MVIRGGYSLLYDRIGFALATIFDKSSSFGMSTLSRQRSAAPTRRFQAQLRRPEDASRHAAGPAAGGIPVDAAARQRSDLHQPG